MPKPRTSLYSPVTSAAAGRLGKLPIVPMLAKLSTEIPARQNYLFEPKWDGIRCIAEKSAERVELWSRQKRPLTRYFPELRASLDAVPGDLVVDGEIVVRRGREFDFEALLLRLHPADSRIELLSRTTPSSLVAFDLLRYQGVDLSGESFETRRRMLEQLPFEKGPHIELSPLTRDLDTARSWLHDEEFEGVVAKHRLLRYLPGKRAMIKIKTFRSADCVVAGVRPYQSEPYVGSLLLGIFDGEQRLIHVGLAASFGRDARKDLTSMLAPFLCNLEGHPWAGGFPEHAGPVGRLPGAGSRWGYEGKLTWLPLRPELVCEVVYDRLDGNVFRHPARLKRWRPDRDPTSCTWDQFTTSA